MDYGLIQKVYLERFLVLVLACYCIVRILNKKTLINPQNAIAAKQKFIIDNNKSLDLLARICMVIYVLYAIPFAVFPALLDIPYVMNENYATIECKTISHDKVGDLKKIRDIEVIDVKTNINLYLRVNYTPINENEYYKINYLPHLRIGKIVDKR